MTLQKKLLLTLLGGLAVILPVTQGLQHLHSQGNLQTLNAASAELVNERERQSAENVHTALDVAVSDFLARGEMDIFSRLVALQKQIAGFSEFSLYDQQGVVTHSSDPAAIKRSLTPELKGELFRSPRKLVRTNPDSFEIYQPQIAEAKCLECHDDFKRDAVCGVTYFRFANDAVARMNTQYAAAGAQAGRRNLIDGFWVFLVQFAVVGGVVCLASRSVARTVRRVGGALATQEAQVELAVAGLSNTNRAVAEAAVRQADSLASTRQSLDALDAVARQGADNARKVTVVSQKARQAAEAGAAEVKQMADAMQAIRSSSNDIAQIIKTIDQIAFQTNILALNAAVEAARAGEAGRGFAVVADEVRNLAQRSAGAARETAAMIEGARNKTALGVEMSARVAQGFEQIVAHTRNVDELASESANVAAEQGQGVQRLTESVNDMDQVTQSNAAHAEEGASAAEELNAQAKVMKQSVGDLLELVGSDQGPVSRTVSAGKSPALRGRQAASRGEAPATEVVPRIQVRPAPVAVPPNGKG